MRSIRVLDFWVIRAREKGLTYASVLIGELFSQVDGVKWYSLRVVHKHTETAICELVDGSEEGLH